MFNFIYHSKNTWSTVVFYYLTNPFQSKSSQSPFLILRLLIMLLLTCFTLIFAIIALNYPLKTFSKETPLCFAIVPASLNCNKASKVALTTLCGFEEPCDFDKYIMYSNCFQYSSNCTTSNYTCTMRSRLNINSCTSKFTFLLMRQSSFIQAEFESSSSLHLQLPLQ